MKTTIAMLALCGLFIGGAAWGHPCPEGENAAVNQIARSPGQGLSDYEELRPRFSTFEVADRKRREKRGKHAYINISYPALKAEYMAWELLQEITRAGGKSGNEHEALRPRFGTFEDADRKRREKRGKHAYVNTSYSALKTEYILWEILKLVRSEGFCK